MTTIKILIMIAVLLVLAYPFIPLPGKLAKLSVFSSLRFKKPHNRKNIFFLALVLVEFIIVSLIFGVFDQLAAFVNGIPFVGNLFSNLIASLNSQVDFVLFTLRLILVNFIVLYAFIIVKAILKRILCKLFGIQTKKEKKAKATDTPEKTPEELKAEEEAEEKRKRRRVPDFIHSEEEEDPEQESAEEKKEEGSDDPAAKEKDDPEAKKDAPAEAGKEPKRRYGKVMSWILSIFFTGEEFEYAKPWVIRVRMVLRCFAVLIEIMYLLFIGIVLASMFFALPMKLYDILVNVLRIGNWYLYPVISLLFLHEICNIFECARPYDREEDPEAQAATEQKKVEARLRKLLYELKKRFDSEHALRYYPEAPQTKIPEYKCKNETFRSALQHIRRMMQNASGRVVESYMECLDAICNDEHVYFASSFYSELGEYLIAYTYVRLLSGARMIFVVSDPDRRETLRTYISERLMKMTGSATAYSWRVYTADERLDQADVLIACPRDFKDGNIVSQYPGFFEEASNAIFIDADRTVALDSYLCPVMAKRLQQATDGRIRFVFLSLDLYKGFSGGSLPRFFCVERVLFFSSAQESESVSYVLWNRESKSHRVYNRFGQRPTSLECIIAQLACRYGIDGVRLITDAALEHSERKLLAAHDVELNNLYRGVADVNYMIYSDTRCNLSSAIYACTRFRGRKKSVVHIISRPYLLREYFVARAAKEEFTNRSSFIQPHVPEHAERHKLSLLRLFCDVMDDTKRSGQGLVIEEFETRMRDVISICRERGDIISSVFCKRMIECRDVSTLKLHELAAYMIAGLCDNDGYVDAEREAACLRESYGNRAKDFYIIVDPAAQDGYSLRKEKYIVFNRSREVLDRLFACNRRVELRLNDRTVGLLDTFPNRVHLEYIAGQSIVYQNAEYEIEHIAKDGHAVYLRRENIKIRNCLDTVLLRRYEIGKTEPLAAAGVLHNTRLMLEEIRVTKCRADFVGETYGFYGLTSDKQPLDFYHKDGVDGNPHVDDPHVRRITDGRVLKVEFRARMECNDGMRLLLAAVFNEFARTVFPKTYHSLAIVPVLASPLPFDEAVEPQTEIERIKALYPYLKHPNGENTETDPHRLAFYFVNDCSEDVGIFDWFYDRSGRYMQEFLVNVYSYLHWLKLRPEMNHYIYFGGTAIPECYDLEGCCALLEGYNLLLSDHGEFNIETAGEDVGEELPERCAFCHRPMESGRYSFFDKARYICAECFDIVDDEESLRQRFEEVRKYLKATYPDVVVDRVKIALDPIYQLAADQVLSEFYYRLDISDRTIYTERDEPVDNVRVSLLRGMIELWQADHELVIDYAKAQLYYEELIYLRSLGLNESADWIYGALDDALRAQVEEIAAYVGKGVAPVEKPDNAPEEGDPETPETPEVPEAPETPEVGGRTSFDFMLEKLRAMTPREKPEKPEEEPEDPAEAFESLYDPNKVPRFWKRYLRGEKLDTGEEEELPEKKDVPEEGDPEVESEEVEETEEEEGSEENSAPTYDNAPAPGEGDPKEDPNANAKDDPTDDPKEEPEEPAEEPEEPAEEPEEPAEEPEEPAEEPEEPAEEPEEDPKARKKREREEARERKKQERERKKEERKRKRQEKKGEAGEDPEEPEEPKKKRARKPIFGKKLSPGEKILPHEEDEDTNPHIRIYNEMVRAAYNYSEAEIPHPGFSPDVLNMIFNFVKDDYPELFWVHTICHTSSTVQLVFRCKDANGRFDAKQVNKKRAELRRGAKTFTRGITGKTDPYEALLTIYRRLILTLDYDSIGLSARIDRDESRDDPLRSLYGALVTHKVVCAGYAFALQYLLQSVGIVCGYVSSERLNGSGHAFNMLKLGKYCYYIDATWGDPSNTQTGDAYQNRIGYDYFCVPFEEFTLTDPASDAPLHTPWRKLYPMVETFHHTNHEYFRYHNAYLRSYNEAEVIRIFADTALAFDEDEMGEFAVAMRFGGRSQAESAVKTLEKNGTLFRVIDRAYEVAAKKNKKKAEYLKRKCTAYSAHYHAGTVYFYFDSPKKPKKKPSEKKK